jgi:hypothetical protein
MLYQSKVAGILLVIIGIVFFYNPTILHLKIGITLAIIGGFLLFLVTDTQDHNTFQKNHIILVMSLWVIFLFVITGNNPPEIYFLMIAIGITAIKELTNEIITPVFKQKLNIFVFLFFLIFLAIVTQKIISVFHI